MKNNYASLPDRVQAAVIDSIVLIALVYGISEIFLLFNDVHQTIRIGAFVLVFILYDPILTSTFGGTIGHSKSGITVKREDNHERNIHFLSAIIRFVCKALLGWISLLTVTGNEKRKAIHDHLVESVVLKEEQ